MCEILRWKSSKDLVFLEKGVLNLLPKKVFNCVNGKVPSFVNDFLMHIII